MDKGFPVKPGEGVMRKKSPSQDVRARGFFSPKEGRLESRKGKGWGGPLKYAEDGIQLRRGREERRKKAMKIMEEWRKGGQQEALV